MTAPDQRVAYREGEFDAAQRVLSARRLRAAAAARLLGARARAASRRRPVWRPPLPEGSRRRIRRPVRRPRRPTPRSRLPRASPRTWWRSGATSARTTAASATASPRPTRPTWRAGRWPARTCRRSTTGAGSPASDLIQLVVSGRTFDRCKGLTHYTLRGCREDVNCPIPDWDFTASPPAWWPCGP